jgi:hypothetical protein
VLLGTHPLLPEAIGAGMVSGSCGQPIQGYFPQRGRGVRDARHLETARPANLLRTLINRLVNNPASLMAGWLDTYFPQASQPAAGLLK